MPEQIGILILFLVVVLFNLISGFLSRRREASAPEPAETEAPPRIPARLPPRVVVAAPRATPPSAPPAAEPIRVAPLRRASRPRPRRLDLGRPADLRRAVLLLTVLGPCRGLERESGDPSRPYS